MNTIPNTHSSHHQTATTVVVPQQPVIQQSVVFRDRPVLVTDSNGHQVSLSCV